MTLNILNQIATAKLFRWELACLVVEFSCAAFAIWLMFATSAATFGGWMLFLVCLFSFLIRTRHYAEIFR